MQRDARGRRQYRLVIGVAIAGLQEAVAVGCIVDGFLPSGGIACNMHVSRKRVTLRRAMQQCIHPYMRMHGRAAIHHKQCDECAEREQQ